jgi:glycine cleavage system H lipoate-binding protein
MGINHMKKQMQSTPPDCVWMQAGVVNRKSCAINYDCVSCRFDKAMRRIAGENKELSQKERFIRGEKGKILYWKEKLKEVPPWKRPCLHHLKGRIDFRACTNEYKCGHCEFDQFFQDQYTVHTVIKQVNLIDIKGFKVPQGFYLHNGHAWAKIEESSSVRIGLDEFALKMLGPLDKIEAPLLGKEVKQNHASISLDRRPEKAKVLSPVSGVVTDINPKLREKGSIANKNPYSEGWVMRIHAPNLRNDLKNLMIGTETKDFVEKEVDRLFQVIEEEAGPIAADGGNLVDDIYGNVPGIKWDKLARLFLHT